MYLTFSGLKNFFGRQHPRNFLLLAICFSIALGSWTEQKTITAEPDLFAIDPEIYYSEEIEYAQLHDPKKRLLQNLVFSTDGLEEGRWILYAMGNKFYEKKKGKKQNT